MEEKEKKQRITFTLDPALIARLRKISADTMIPQARLVERALEQVVSEYEVEPASPIEASSLDEVIELLDLPTVIFNKIRSQHRDLKTIQELMDVDRSRIRNIGVKHLETLNNAIDEYVKKHS